MAIKLGTVIALIQALAPKVSPEVIEAAVSDWLDEHPEATTTVEDGSITEQKLAAELATKLSNMDGDITELKSDIQLIDGFMDANDIYGNQGVKQNVIQSPYLISEVTDRAIIFSDGTVNTGNYDTFVSPLIPIVGGMYGLKAIHGTYNSGALHPGNDYDNGFGFYGADGETVVSRPSHATVLGNDIFLIEVPDAAKFIRFTVMKSGASYSLEALQYFNQWIFLPNADSTITDDFFDLGTPKEDKTVDKLLRSDGSKIHLADEQARNAIAEMNVDEMKKFMEANDFNSNVVNLLGVPFKTSEIVPFAMILSNGSVRAERNNYDRNYTVSPLIPVSAGIYALYTPVGQGDATRGQITSVNDGYGLYGSDGSSPVAKVSITPIGSGIFSIVVPQNAAFIRFCYYHGSSSAQVFSDENVERGRLYVNNNWVLIKSDSQTLTPDDFAKKQNGVTKEIQRADGSHLIISTSELSEKKIIVFGDSIWGNDRTDGICDFLARYSGATVYNCAIGGTRITGDRSTYDGAPAWKAFDGLNLINAKLTDTWTDQDQYVGDVASYVATETLPLLKSVDMSTVDIVILAYGHNDFTGNKTISQITAAYETVITEILTAYPRIRILVCTSPWRMFDDEDGDLHENNNGDTLREMDDGIIAMAKANHIAVLDTFAEVPWRALTASVYLDADEVHPSTEGNKVYAHVVYGKLRSMY